MRRRGALAGIAVLAALAVTGCQDDGPVAESAAADTTVAVTDPTVATTVEPTDATATTTAPDAVALMTAALDALGSQYHFTTQVTVNGSDVLSADGDRVDTGARLTIVQGTSTADYVIVGDASWTRVNGGAWTALETAPSSTDPLNGLRAATAATVTGAADQQLTLTLTVPAVSLGIAADGDATVDIVITNGVLSDVRYATTVGDQPAQVVTKLGPVVDATPVLPPV